MVDLFDRRINNILIAMKRTKDPQMIRIWENKILELFEKMKSILCVGYLSVIMKVEKLF